MFNRSRYNRFRYDRKAGTAAVVVPFVHTSSRGTAVLNVPDPYYSYATEASVSGGGTGGVWLMPDFFEPKFFAGDEVGLVGSGGGGTTLSPGYFEPDGFSASFFTSNYFPAVGGPAATTTVFVPPVPNGNAVSNVPDPEWAYAVAY